MTSILFFAAENGQGFSLDHITNFGIAGAVILVVLIGVRFVINIMERFFAALEAQRSEFTNELHQIAAEVSAMSERFERLVSSVMARTEETNGRVAKTLEEFAREFREGTRRT